MYGLTRHGSLDQRMRALSDRESGVGLLMKQLTSKSTIRGQLSLRKMMSYVPMDDYCTEYALVLGG